MLPKKSTGLRGSYKAWDYPPMQNLWQWKGMTFSDHSAVPGPNRDELGLSPVEGIHHFLESTLRKKSKSRQKGTEEEWQWREIEKAFVKDVH